MFAERPPRPDVHPYGGCLAAVLSLIVFAFVGWVLVKFAN